MAITVGTTKSNSGNQAGSSGFSFNHTTDANTKCLVVVVTGVDTSATDSVVSGVTWNSVALVEIAGGRYRVGNDFISIWYKVLPAIGGAFSVSVTMGGSCTDVQATALNLVDASAYSIVYDSFDTGTGTGSATSTVSPAVTNSIAVGGGVADGGTPASLSITAGTEATGSEVDMGSQVASVGYASESGGAATITWTYAAVVCSSLAATFYSQFTPTVSLSTPADAGSTSDTTPDLVFTGTDSNSDEVEYQVQVDKSSDFGASAFDSYVPDDESEFSFGDTTNDAVGQSFTGTGRVLDRLTVRLKKTNSPTGNAVANIYAHTGTFGDTSGVPTGSVLAASGNLDVTTLTTSLATVTFTFTGANKITLVNGTKYFLAIEFPSRNASNNVITIGLDNTSPTHNGRRTRLAVVDGLWNSNTNSDLAFAIYGDPLLDKASDTPSIPGFAGTGDPHPWPSGNAVTYTVQGGDALSNSVTYYWRVRGKDTGGTNTYGSWSSTYSFTVSTGGGPVIPVFMAGYRQRRN